MTFPPGIAATRESWQRVAEHLMAPELHRHTGRVGLRPSFRGVATPEFMRDGQRSQLRIESTQVALLTDSTESWVPLTTLAEVADRLGIAVEPIDGVFDPVTSADPHEALPTDAAGASALGDWVALVDEALATFRSRHRDSAPSIAQLWPEHFDLAVSMTEINFGGALGDHAPGGRPEPYLYVGPWEARRGDFWTEPFGAARDAGDVPDVDSAIDFFEAGLVAATRDGRAA